MAIEAGIFEKIRLYDGSDLACANDLKVKFL